MISDETQKAVCTLQKQATRSAELKAQERDERAIDELLRHPENPLPEHYQRRNAVRHARWDQTRKAKKASYTSLDDAGQFQTGFDRIIASDPRYLAVIASADHGFGIGDILEWLTTSLSLREADRALLMALADGYDAELMALLHNVPLKRMRERISRARSRGWAIYLEEVLAA